MLVGPEVSQAWACLQGEYIASIENGAEQVLLILRPGHCNPYHITRVDQVRVTDLA